MQINGKNYCDNCFRELTHDSCDYCTKKIKEINGALPVGTILFDRFIVGKPIDQGKSAISYYGYDQAQNRRVLLKEFIPTGIAERAEDGITVAVLDDDAFGVGLERFFAEARALSNFKKCDGIIKIYKFFNENGTSYYVTELLDGYDLEKYLKKLSRNIPETAAVKIVLKTLDALADVHALEPCHGQLSPRNIFLCSNGMVKLSDAGGLSSAPGDYASLYAPIERKIRNYGRAAAATDIYSVGAIMYQMITGKTVPDPISRLENDTLDLDSISDQLRPVIRTMLEILPKNRYQSISELRVALNGRLTIKASPTALHDEHHESVKEAENVGRAGNTGNIGNAGNSGNEEYISTVQDQAATAEFDFAKAASRADTASTDIPEYPNYPEHDEDTDMESVSYDEDQFFSEMEAQSAEENNYERRGKSRLKGRNAKDRQRLLTTLYVILGCLSALLVWVLLLLLR